METPVPSSIAQSKIQSLLDEAYAKRVNDLSTSIKLGEEALKISKDLDDKAWIGKSLVKLSLFHMIIGDFELSKNMANEAIECLDQIRDEKGIADAKYTIAGTLYKTDDYYMGLRYLIDCHMTYDKLKDYHNLSRVEKSMGTIYEYFGDTERAIKVYQDAVESGEKARDKNLQSNAFNPLSGIYLNEGNIQKAMDLIEKSIQFKKETNDVRGLAFALYGRGKVYTANKDFQKAENDFLESERIHKEMGEILGIAMSYHKLGALYIEMNKLQEAEEVLVKALEYSNKNRIILIKFKANLLLHEIAKKRGDHELALKYLQQYIDEKESVINNRTAKVIESYETVTEMNRLEQEARAQKEKADLIEKKKIELDSFFYRVSHDLKGPIASMISLNYIAKLDVKDETALGFINDYEAQANRLNKILDGLLSLTKISFNEDRKQAIDFNKVIKDCMSSYKFLQNFEQVEFKVHVDNNIKYEAEWALVNTVIQNLIENGIKYARLEENKPFIDISVTDKRNHVVIHAKDNGIGMDQETVEKIFTMFFRVNRKIEGTGLGLHILKRAIERLDGSVEVQSTLGEGTSFHITLPK